MISKLHFKSTRLIVDSCDLVEETLKKKHPNESRSKRLQIILPQRS